MLIRREVAADVGAVVDVHTRAFRADDGPASPVEVVLLERLRRSEAWLPRLSLVAVTGAEVVGHVVCTRAEIQPHAVAVLGLGPIGVAPDHQGRGVGAALMHAVLGAADARDERLVCLLGEPAFYRRFGFVPASELGIEAPEPSWGEYFQARVLSAFEPGLRGRFRYAAPFDAV